MSAQLAVLGLLAEGPNHGYGIQRLIDQRGMRNWTSIGFSSIYFVLDRLVDQGWAQVHTEPAPGRGKHRKVHTITAHGRQVWHRKLLGAFRDVASSGEEFLLAMSCLPLLDPGEVRTALEQRAAQLRSRIADLDRQLAAVRPVPAHVAAMFDYTTARLRQEHDWVTNFITDWLNQSPAPEEGQR